ncbi:PAS domain-containing sensor histidine kinase [Spirosoma linguale]|uniref:histidine kinase n=1 Tax=Spirosoma linguale (strain ATCC 33905 / DSM 74 / LMG 10896 / Claus 1) TaxID=504472 RepID=D2QBY1_SPILD|nr:histidine kinase [Spirosoma linguale DSM 74]
MALSAISSQFLNRHSEIVELIIQKNWRLTALGPLEEWPQSLQTTLSICLHSRFPILFWWGPEFKMIYNDAYAPLLGNKHPAAFGSRGDQVWGEVWDSIGPRLTQVMKSGESTWSENERFTINRHGFLEEGYFTFSYSPIYVESGKIGGVFTVVTETTQVILAQQQLRLQHDQIEQINGELESKIQQRTQGLHDSLAALEKTKLELAQALLLEQALSKLKSQFVAMASHEFRTPLTVIKTSVDLVEKYTEHLKDLPIQKHFDRIGIAINHLITTLEDFLLMGQLDEGQTKVKPYPFNLVDAVNQLILDIEVLVKPNQRVESQIECFTSIYMDATLLRKILLNLLINAIKYSGSDSTIRIQGACADGLLTLSVIDQGIGIAEEEQPHIFERFFRAPNATTIAGTGLGLYIVRHYVGLLNGQVSLSSELNKGTTVTLTFPC